MKKSIPEGSGQGSLFNSLVFTITVAALAFYGGRHSVRQQPSDASLSTLHNITAALPEKPAPVDETPFIVTPKANDWDALWKTLTTQPSTPSEEAQLVALIEKMARTDPQRALSLAASQANLRLRTALLVAALKGWGTVNPQAAAQWAQSQSVMDQSQAINALLKGAAGNPDQAFSVANALIQNNPGRTEEYGSDLISALSEAGQFHQAADFAISGSGNCRDDWMLTAFSRWAEFQPQSAVAGAMEISDPDLQKAALNAIMVGWAPTDPKGLIDYAQNSLPPEQFNLALPRALQFWAGTDPAAAATWISQNNPGGAADLGVSEIALSAQLGEEPQLAADWASSISNPQLRSDTLENVFKKWASTDLAASENFLENSTAIPADLRSQILNDLQNEFKP